MSDTKGFDELIFGDDIRYDQEHTWVRVQGEDVIVGISDFAQDRLGDIVFLELPSVGDILEKGDVFGQAESVKSVSALYLPVGGEIVAVNETLADSPDLVKRHPYEEGWLVILKPSDLGEVKKLLTKEEYLGFLKDSESL